MNDYQTIASQIQTKIEKDVNTIYELCANKLILGLAKENLLELSNNCIESSTAIGYCLEEFLIKKLLKLDSEFYKRGNKSTGNASFDLFIEKHNIKILINLKANKSNNNAIAALSQLYKDYTDGKSQKLFMVFKSNYLIKNKIINIIGTESFYLEQCYFNQIKTDNRSWSKENNNLSGRIQYNPKKGLKDIDSISYEKTFEDLKSWVEKKTSE